MKKNNKGFTLLELSIVLLIMGFITTASLTVTKGLLNNEKQKNTKEKIYKIETAINDFIVKNNRLPCPASIEEKYLSNSNIEESFDETSCLTKQGIKLVDNIYIGTIPASSIGIQNNDAKDGWSNKFTYVVVKDYVKEDSILENVDDSLLINEKFAYAIISSGRNQYFSYSFSGNEELKNSTSSEKDEQNSYKRIKNNTIVEGWGDTDFDDFTLLKSVDKIKQDLDIFDSICNLKTSEKRNTINNNCGSEYFISLNDKSLKYKEKIYSSEEFFEEKTITDSDGNIKIVFTKLKNCVIECSKHGRLIIYLNKLDL